MRFAKPSLLALSSLSVVVAACSEEPVAALAKAPLRVVDGGLPAPMDFEALVVEGQGPVAAAPRSLLEQEALFAADDHDWLLEGRRLLDDKRPGEAIEALRKALFQRADGETFALLGQGYLAAGERARGVACLEEALVIDASAVDVRERLARAYVAAGQGHKARRHGFALTKVRPDEASSHYLLGRGYMQLSMWSEAVDSLTKAVELAPASSHAYNNLGYSALMIGRHEQALDVLEALLDLEPVTAYMMNNLGVAYEKNERGPDAYAAFLRAVELKPGYVNALVNRDRVASGLSDRERALALDILEELKQPLTTGSTVAAARAAPGDEATVVLESGAANCASGEEGC
jgi:tetratricopeptide (TPR) repeat protein